MQKIKQCTIDGCNNIHFGRGLCKKHHSRQRRGQDITAKSRRDKTSLDRFEEKVVRNNGCWEWTGIKNAHGYGKIWDGDKMALAHRLSYILFVGPIPQGLCVLHKCDNPECTNPEHLWIGTKKDNSVDMVKKGRSVVGSRQGRSKLTEEDVIKIRSLYPQTNQRELAEMFGVANTMISLIVNRKNWTHI